MTSAPTTEAASRRVMGAVTVAVFADSLLYSAVVPVLPTYAERHGASTTGVGLLFASYAVALLVLTPLAGLLADRHGARRVLLAGAVGVAAATALFAVADGFWALAAARSLQGAAAGAVWTGGVAAVAQTVAPARLGTALGTVVAGMSAGVLLGPPAAGFLVGRWGFHAPFVALAVFTAGSAALQLLVPRDRTAATPAESPLAVLRAPAFRRTLVVVAAAAAGLSMLEPLLPLDLAGRLGASPERIGLVFGVATLAHLLSAPVVGALSDRYGRAPMMAAGLLAMAATLPLVALAPSPAWTAAVLVGYAVGYSLVLVPALPETADVVRRRGGGYATAYAAFNIAYALGMVVGPTGGSAAVEVSSLTAGLVATSGVLALAAVLATRAARATEIPGWSDRHPRLDRPTPPARQTVRAPTSTTARTPTSKHVRPHARPHARPHRGALPCPDSDSPCTPFA